VKVVQFFYRMELDAKGQPIPGTVNADELSMSASAPTWIGCKAAR
jgi:hypothetical protein